MAKKKIPEIPLEISEKYNKLNQQYKISINDYKFYIRTCDYNQASIVLDSIRTAEKKLELLAEIYSLPNIIEFNPARQKTQNPIHNHP